MRHRNHADKVVETWLLTPRSSELLSHVTALVPTMFSTILGCFPGMHWQQSTCLCPAPPLPQPLGRQLQGQASQLALSTTHPQKYSIRSFSCFNSVLSANNSWLYITLTTRS